MYANAGIKPIPKEIKPQMKKYVAGNEKKDLRKIITYS